MTHLLRGLACLSLWLFTASGMPGEFPEIVTLDDCVLAVKNGDARLIDARPRDLYRRGHIPGAVNLPLDDFENAYAGSGLSADRTKPLIVYCTSLHCQDSMSVLRKLKALGHARAAIFKEGYAGWWKAKQPVEKLPPAEK